MTADPRVDAVSSTHSSSPASGRSCTNCGDERVDVYCASCGERQPDHHDLTVGHFAHEVFHELVHLDSKLFRTLKDLVFRPGKLTVEYFSGQKKRAIAPLRLFLTLFALQFVVYSVHKSAALYNVETFMRFDQSGKMTGFVEEQAAKRGLTVPAYIERLNARWHRNLSLLQLTNILGVAVILKLLYAWRKRFFVEHLVFTAHFLSFSYLFAIVVWPIYFQAGLDPGPLQQAMSVVTIGLLLVYLFIAQRRYYGVTRKAAVAKTLLLYGGTYAVGVAIMSGALIAAAWSLAV
ncbi:MAG TPA: DUF3667 domain-containing protein [Thermoanaerobaculia bacterium]